jgi:hypothetical protein
MIPKKSDSIKVDKLHTIVLMEADFNYLNKIMVNVPWQMPRNVVQLHRSNMAAGNIKALSYMLSTNN